ncbi:PEP-CTERM sorting domain-containing protein [Janthinobacterium fluminis]|uniref:PEP-CTERM sorting domain-containing protein n=1 Tax=Janthinobacterium fluminis TaxID=2987524 RepID=A0ABT5JUT9_9BURK|nr:PEP-CTERM sorting domain-containing protein [Janthinobacterium fluminis]MDC8756517.1 PEP-CTERM sorting domain-containing protein [Janthinobacterium fluminis]
MLDFKFHFRAAFAVLAFATAQASATSIPILNASFEADTTYGVSGGQNKYTVGSPANWSAVGTSGYWHPSDYHYGGGMGTKPAPNVPDGVNVGFIFGGGSLSQTLGATLTSNTSYTLSLAVGHRIGLGQPSYLIELLAGGKVIASFANPIHPSSGKFGLATLNYESSAHEDYVGRALGIRLSSLSSAVEFDKIALNAVSAVPEAQTYAMLLTGLGLLGFVRRRGARGKANACARV